jgi:glycerol kinase
MARSDKAGSAVAAALDLGSTNIKGALLDASGRLIRLRSLPSPALRGAGTIREADAGAYFEAADELAQELTASAPRNLPLGLTTQRSSFVLWDRRTGTLRTPLISWQDRRAASWCERNADATEEVSRISGLVLTAHYAGPKLAALREQDPRLAAEMDDGALLFGTLDTYLIWRWTGGELHQAEPTMAARTAAAGLATLDWSDDLLRLYGVPRDALPVISSGSRRRVELGRGAVLGASLADQASSALTALDPAEDAALVNLGTGGFVLLPARDPGQRRAGYLTAPILCDSGFGNRFVLEGSINGAGMALDRFGLGPTWLPETDDAPDAFALPDCAGLGSPHWLPGIAQTLSPAAQRLNVRDRRRVVLEGLLFRVREILEGLAPLDLPRRILLSGGLAAEPALGPGLATLLDRPVERLEQRESTLLGVARLAAGLEPLAPAQSQTVEPGGTGAYLRDKFEHWRGWHTRLISARPDS